MASRRDELNAYNFARKRTVGAFLQPGGGGNDEDAPRPLRAVLPSFVVGAVIVAGFGMWGVIKPSAPLNWDDGKNIVQGKDSTTRYVVLEDPQTHEKVLHQVLNMSSARLVLPAGSKVVQVADNVLDEYKNHGATIGIPYAPDRLPNADDAGEAKKWSVCNRPGSDNSQATVNQAVFIAADADAKTLAKPDLMLSEGQDLFVQGPPIQKDTPGSKFLVDMNGVKHAIGEVSLVGTRRSAMEYGLFGDHVEPQQVTQAWLDTLDSGEAVTFPKIPGFDKNTKTKSDVKINSKLAVVGHLVRFQNTYYVVGKSKLIAVTPFQAELIRNDPDLEVAYGRGVIPKVDELSPAENAELSGDVDKSILDTKDLPAAKPLPPVNVGPKATRTVVCSTFEGYDHDAIKRTVWASTDYPAKVSLGSASAHVTPGHGLLYRAVDGQSGPGMQDSSGSIFLVTETGLRYSLSANGDGGTGGTPVPSPSPQQQQQAGSQDDDAKARLGFKSVTPSLVPLPWSALVPGGGVLSSKAAEQAQSA
ncbi:type VII secretion protein EccB [Kitasatospora sp. NPDC059571]|uniref:type VII secretion protein EccB n=1 Tax=Kitasatospora sp. NPDC059571 TaxID=3346871 RepID=UPI00367F44AF